MYEDKLIYGKNALEKIVAIEPKDNYAELFIQDDQGNVQIKMVPNKYWILSSRPIKGFSNIRGTQHYRFGKQFVNKQAWFQDRKKYKEQDIYSIYDSKESLMIKDGYTYYKGLTPKDVSILSFDIETTGLNHDENSKILIISNTFRKCGVVSRKLFCYDEFIDEGEMLVAWCNWVREVDPSIITGHNVESYDFSYIKFIADKFDISLNLGRDDSELEISNYESNYRVDQTRSLTYNKPTIYGREIIDTMFLAYKYDVATKKYTSYGLKSIIAQEGLEVKDRQFYDAATIRDNYKIPCEWEKIKLYAEFDADDSLALFDLMCPPFFYMAQSIPKSFQSIVEGATGSQINSMMVRSYLQDGHSVAKSTPVNIFQGAISSSVPGVYKNLFKQDVKSMYPSVMLEYSICDIQKDPKQHLTYMLNHFTQERFRNKKLAKDTGDMKYTHLEQSQKVAINSFYGFLGTKGLNYNFIEGAAEVTETGRAIIIKAVEWAESQGFTIANVDTDAICYTDNGKEISEERRKLLTNDLNSLFPEKIQFEDDGYFLSGCILKTKNYILWDGKKIKNKGSALKDPKKEPALKEFLDRVIKTLLGISNENVIDIYLEYVKEINNVTDINRWATKKTVSDKTLESDRTNESRIRDAFAGEEVSEGDKIYCFFLETTKLCLVKNFNGVYSKEKLLKKLHDTASIFSTVIDVDNCFKNYSLKRNNEHLQTIWSDI